MSVLYFLENIRNPVLDLFFSFITLYGEETVFMAVGMIIFWCFDKYQGYYLLCTGFTGTILNQFMKMTFRIPRPWVKDPSFTIVESAREAATGYSFPSGHTQTSVGLYGGIARWNRNRTIRIIAICFCVLVPLSRLYLGVHTPLDVIVSVGIALALIFLGYPLFQKAAEKPKLMFLIMSILAFITVAYTVFVCAYPFPEEVYTEGLHNLESARKNGFTLLGCIFGMIVIYAMDLKVIRFTTTAVWWAQILKAAGGIALVLATKELLRAPLDALFQGSLVARAVRYFLVVIVAGLVWPLTFRWFSGLGQKKKS